MQPILAIDMGKNKSIFCDYDPASGETQFGTVPTSPKDFHDLLVERSGRVMVIEICPLAGWVADLCLALGVEAWIYRFGASGMNKRGDIPRSWRGTSPMPYGTATALESILRDGAAKVTRMPAAAER